MSMHFTPTPVVDHETTDAPPTIHPGAQCRVVCVPLLEPDELTKQINDALYRSTPAPTPIDSH
jgi:hypothetical protein